VAAKLPAKERAKTVNANTKKTPIQNEAKEFLRAVRRLLQASANPHESDPSFMHASTLRTLQRCVRGLEEAKTDPDLAAAMRLSLDLLGNLQMLGFTAAEDQILLDEPDPEGHVERATELMQLIEELEAIRKRERE
jgi:hypothetical protein